jgi:2-polyprenyl-3-methyl-5-hydroxy-6-metoxy-1,4-benzoquinol methylase
LIEEYRGFNNQVDIVVLSDIPKDLGSDVEVRVGAPTRNPYSLPFGYKPLFSERQDQYDLFIYSEDDTLITEENVFAFLDVNKYLPKNKIAGFIRYETDQHGTHYFSTINNHYHWDPISVYQYGPYKLAYCTNEHSACFILTQEQLKSAIKSGGFNKPPRVEKYDMLVTAATDPYTQCGFQKVVPISHLNQFSLKHLPNVYIGKMGVVEEEIKAQIEVLLNIEKEDVVGPLVDPQRLEGVGGAKQYYERCRKDILGTIPVGVKSVLSVGCVCGETESEISKRGITVVGVPMDAVIAVSAKMRGIETVPPNHDAAIQALSGRKFDCIVFSEVLENVADPAKWLTDYQEFLNPGGCFVISAANSTSMTFLGWLLGYPIVYRKNPDKQGVLMENPGVPGDIPNIWYQRSKLKEEYRRWRIPVSRKLSLLRRLGLPSRWLADRLVVRAAPC